MGNAGEPRAGWSGGCLARTGDGRSGTAREMEGARGGSRQAAPKRLRFARRVMLGVGRTPWGQPQPLIAGCGTRAGVSAPLSSGFPSRWAP